MANYCDNNLYITGEPERVLLQDKPMMLAVITWMVAVIAILIIFPRPPL